jgi:hypothetical protein
VYAETSAAAGIAGQPNARPIPIKIDDFRFLIDPTPNETRKNITPFGQNEYS